MSENLELHFLFFNATKVSNIFLQNEASVLLNKFKNVYQLVVGDLDTQSFKWAILYIFFRYFVFSKQIQNSWYWIIKFADEWIWTADLWFRKQQPLLLPEIRCIGQIFVYLFHKITSLTFLYFCWFMQPITSLHHEDKFGNLLSPSFL